MRRPAFLTAAALIVLPQVAAAAVIDQPCLTPREVAAVSGYALPSLISGTAQRCAASLPESAFLRTSSHQMAQKYAARKAVVWPETKAALIKLSGGTNDKAAELFKSMPDETLQQIADSMVSGIVTEKLPVARCGTIDHLLALLSPLPAENTAELIALTVGLVSRGDKPTLGKFAVCKA